jgi:O-acetylhomoserine (thiol)-lyase
MSDATNDWKFETKQIHSGAAPDPVTKARATPIYQTTSYVFDNADHAKNLFALAEFGNIYTRIQNPTQDVLEQRLAALEGGTGALVLASGQAASTFAVLNIAEAGDHFVASSSIYGGTYNLFKYTLAKLGIETTFVENPDDLDSWRAAVRPNTKAFFGESISNPKIDILDIPNVAAVAHEAGVPLIVDNTIATPYLIRPFEHGADIVVHSATKFIGGHGTTLGGVIVEGGTFDWEAADGKYPQLTEPNPSYHGVSFVQAAGPAALVTYIRAILLRDQGATLSPFNAFLLLQGTETLAVRLDRHVENTKKVVAYLQGQPLVDKLNHPSLPDHPDHELYEKYFPNGGASIFTFDIKGGKEAAYKFIDSLKIFSDLANVADVKSLVIHPYDTTHAELSPEELAKAGISQSTIRLSIGIEAAEDIIADLDQAFDEVKKAGLA